MTEKPTPTAAHLRRERRIARMWKFYAEVKAEDCAGISGPRQPTEYTHKHKAMKKKGGKAPSDYTAVELLVDFKAAMRNGLYDEAVTFYYPLRRLLNWEG